MATEIRVPTLGESITEATVARWLKQPGETVERDEPVVELETDKVTLEVPAPAAGKLGEVLAAEGANVPVGAVLGTIADGAAAANASPHPNPPPQAGEGVSAEHRQNNPSPQAGEGGARSARVGATGEGQQALERSGPAVRKLIAETGLDAAQITPTGPGGRLTKADVIAARDQPQPVSEPPAEPTPAPPRERQAPTPPPQREPPTQRPPAERETRVRMTRLRHRIADRLKEAQNTATMLTTYNEIDMSAAIALRERWRESFEKKHGVRLGFMSIFVKAAIVGLKELPAVNAEIDGEDLVYQNHYDIGVAVGTEQGLVVPVVREADRKSFADIEKEIGGLGRKAREGKLTNEALSGGTFTSSNGGVYGPLWATLYLNPT